MNELQKKGREGIGHASKVVGSPNMLPYSGDIIPAVWVHPLTHNRRVITGGKKNTKKLLQRTRRAGGL